MGVDVSVTLPGHIPFERIAQVLRDAEVRQVTVDGEITYPEDDPGMVRRCMVSWRDGRLARFMRVHHFVGADPETQPNMVPYPNHTYAVCASHGNAVYAMRELARIFGGYFHDESDGTKVWAEPGIETRKWLNG